MSSSGFDPKSVQFNRVCSLVIAGKDNNGLDLSNLRIKFAVKRSDTATPNTADIFVYNVDPQTALLIRQSFTQVVLQAGYPGNIGVIFKGSIKQVIIGRESATDTFINLVCGDGDKAYNFAVINQSISMPTAQNQLNAVMTTMAPYGTTQGYVGPLPPMLPPRGKVMFGNAKDYARVIAKNANQTWSIQNGKINFVSKTSYIPETQITITASSGMIGTPQQTTDGVNVKCLLNPDIQISGRIHLDNNTILQQQLNLDQVAAARGNTTAVNNLKPRHLNADGSYYVLALNHYGDTRRTDWYTSLICLNIDTSANPLNGVYGGIGGG